MKKDYTFLLYIYIIFATIWIYVLSLDEILDYPRLKPYQFVSKECIKKIELDIEYMLNNGYNTYLIYDILKNRDVCKENKSTLIKY